MRSLRLFMTLALLSTVASVCAAAGVGSASQLTPSASNGPTIALPLGFHPEGITGGYARYAYVGSLYDGAIYQVDLKTGQGEVLHAGKEGEISVGLAYDARTNYVYAAGGPTRKIRVFDGADGQLKATFFVPEAGFINDGIITRDAAYFTDSFMSVIYKIPLSKTGRLSQQVQIIPMFGDYDFVDGGINWNGIESFDKGKTLVLVNYETGELVRVNTQSGQTEVIRIKNGDLMLGDGLLRVENKLYVTRGSNQIDELLIDHRSHSAEILRSFVNTRFRTPSTSAYFKGVLYTVNGRFDVAPAPFLAPSDRFVEFDIAKTPINKSAFSRAQKK